MRLLENPTIVRVLQLGNFHFSLIGFRLREDVTVRCAALFKQVLQDSI